MPRGILLLCAAVLLISSVVVAQDADPDVVVFYREGCHDCRHIDELLDTLLESYPEVRVRHIEETEPGAERMMWSLAAEYGIFPTVFPVVFAGDEAFTGVGRDKELALRRAVRDCALNGCESPLARIRGPRIPWITVGLVGLAAVLLWLVLAP
jgi:thiol-disulfide isomerase/thioredoxin